MSGFQVDLCSNALPYTCESIHPMGENERCPYDCDILQKLRVSVTPCAIIMIRKGFNCFLG